MKPIGEVVVRNDKLLQTIRDFVFAAMENNDPAHDSDHVRRVAALADTIAKAYPKADSFRIQLLALLHDMHDDKLSSNTDTDRLRRHLLDLGVSPEDVAFALSAIDYISYRKHPKLSPDIALEIRIVQDADRIDAIGATGIARTFAYGGANNRSLQDSLSHFDDKLLKLYDLLSTDEAKRIAKSRQAFLERFYAQFREEFTE